MSRTRIEPEASYPHFHTREKFSTVAKKLGVSRDTLKRWWLAKFGAKAFEDRFAWTKATSEELKQHRKEFREKNRDRLNAEKKAWRLKNPDHVKQLKKQHREKHLAEYKDREKKYYQEHAVEHRKRAREYRQENGDLVRQKERDYYRRYPEKLMVVNARQRAKKIGIPFAITAQDVLDVMPLDGKCPITGMVLEQGNGKVGPNSPSLDRILPELGYVRGNIAVISHLANTIKQDCIDPEVFRRLASYLEGRLRLKSCPSHQ